MALISRRKGCFYTAETERNVYGIQMTHVDTRKGPLRTVNGHRQPQRPEKLRPHRKESSSHTTSKVTKTCSFQLSESGV